MNFDGIPECLKDRTAWIVWRYEGNGEKKTKVPYIAVLKNGELTYRASSMKPRHWNTFEQAVQVYENSDASGLGYVFSEQDPYAVADFDDALSDGTVDESVQEWLNRLDTYTEVSVSGGGFHVICEADIGTGASVAGYEVYDRGRYIAMTGDVWQDRTDVEERGDEFRELSDIVRERQRRLEGRKGLERRRDSEKPFDGESWDLENFLYDNGVSILREVGDAGGRKFMILCPWLNEHTGGDESGTFAGQFDDGALWFDCKHSHCSARKWTDFREAVQTEDGLAEWRRKYEKHKVEITVGSSGGAERQPEPETHEETHEEPREADFIDEFIARSRFLLGQAIHDGIDPPEELLPDVLLAGKAHNIFAPGGVGKTWVLVWLTRELAKRGKTVLAFDLENGRRTYAERFEEVGYRPTGTEWEELDRYVYYFDFPLLHPELYEGLLDRLKPDIVMFDSWIGFLAADGKDENASNDISMWAERYSKPALRRSCAVLVLDHVPHEEKRERGSSRKRDEMDVVWSLNALKEFDRESLGSLAMSKVKDREGWLPQQISYRVGGDPDTGRFVMERDDTLVESIVVVTLDEDERNALDILRQSEEGYRAAEWQRECESIGLMKRDFYRTKKKLDEKDKLMNSEGVFNVKEESKKGTGAVGAKEVHAPVAPDTKSGGSGSGANGATPLRGVATSSCTTSSTDGHLNESGAGSDLPAPLSGQEHQRLQEIQRHTNLKVRPTAHGDQIFAIAGTLSDEDKSFVRHHRAAIIGELRRQEKS